MISQGEIAILCSRAEMQGPEASQVMRDDAGVTWYRFAVDWLCDGRTFTTHLWARDAADAERRLLALRSNGRIVGQVMIERDVA